MFQKLSYLSFGILISSIPFLSAGYPELIEAINKGDLNAVRQEIATGTDVNQGDIKPLFYALASMNYTPHIQDGMEIYDQFQIYLHYEIHYTDTVEHNDDLETSARFQIVEALLDAGADVFATDSWGRTCLYYAFPNVMRLLLITIDEQITNHINAQYKEQLHKIDKQFEEAKQTARSNGSNLVIAQQAYIVETSRLIEERAAKREVIFRTFLEQTDLSDHNRPAIGFLPMVGEFNHVTVLTSSLARFSCRCDAENPTFFLTVADLLLSYGIDLNRHDGNGNTLLHYLTMDCSSECTIRVMLEQEASPNIKNKYGETPFFLAYRKWKHLQRTLIMQTKGKKSLLTSVEDILNMLLKYGADPTIKDYQGHSVLNLSQSAGDTEIIDLFEKYGFPSLQYENA